MKPRIAFVLACVGLWHAAAFADDRPRLLVLTDISSLQAGEAEPDDGQSLIRLMLYANDFEIEGIVASSNLGHGRRVRPELIHAVIDAYEKVQPTLVLHDPRYPAATKLRARVRAGQPNAGREVPREQSVGPGLNTAASRWIVELADREDPRPLNIIVWGGSADLAQALWNISESRPAEALARFVSRLRVHMIGRQDSTADWIEREFPDLSLTIQERAYRGMYRGGDLALVSPDWVRLNVNRWGALGALYPVYNGGDIFPALGPVRGIKEGDTPSFLALVPNGLTDLDRPELGSWGGRFEPNGERPRFVDVPDRDMDIQRDPDPRMATVYRWRSAYQNDFAARLTWCVLSPKEANHAPIVRIAGKNLRAIAPGSRVVLDAEATTDPDADALDFRWAIYPALPQDSGVVLEPYAMNPRRATLVISDNAPAGTVPVLLSVTDDGTPPLTRYARVLVEVEGLAP